MKLMEKTGQIGPKAMNFIPMLKLEEILIFQATVLKLGDLLGAGGYQQMNNFSTISKKFCPLGQKHNNMECEYHYCIKFFYNLSSLSTFFICFVVIVVYTN